MSASPFPTGGQVSPSTANQAQNWSLADFVSVKPAPYVRDPNHSESKGTRPPAFYDLHLAEPLRLKKIVPCDTFTSTLSAVFDRTTPSQFYSQPLNHGLGMGRLMEATLKRNPIICEKSLADDFVTRTANPCMAVASEIIFEASNNFEWTIPDQGNGKAVSDGILSLKAVPSSNSTLHPDDASKIKLIRQYKLENLLVVEFKSLVAAPLKVMKAILRLANGQGDFPWVFCGSSVDGGKAQKCSGKDKSRKANTKHERNGEIIVTGRKTGPDASKVSAWWDAPRTEQTGQKRQTGESSSNVYQTIEGESDPFDLKKAYYIVQQVWAEMVKADTTFAVISAGNYEIILRRHRESCTLYMSSIVRPSEDNTITHYKLHTSLYVAAYLDAVDRAQQLDLVATGKETSVPRWLPDYQREYYKDKDLCPDISNKVAKPKQTRKEQQAILQELFSQLTTLKNITVLPPPHVRGSSGALIFRRQFLYSQSELQSAVADIQLKLDSTAKLAPLVFIDWADSELDMLNFQIDISAPERRLDGKAWLGAVTRKESAHTKDYRHNGIIAKIAMTDGQKQSLMNEYKMYVRSSQIRLSVDDTEAAQAAVVNVDNRRMTRAGKGKARKGGKANVNKIRKLSTGAGSTSSDPTSVGAPVVPFALRTFGWFTCINAKVQCDMLLIENGGEAICQLLQPGSNDFDAETKEKHRLQVFAIVDAFHDQNFLHNDLHADHVLYDKQTKKYSLISFSTTSAMKQELEKAESEKAKIQDMKILMQALDSP